MRAKILFVISFALRGFVAFFYLSLIWVAIYAFLPIPMTPLMVLRSTENLEGFKPGQISYDWRSAEEISPFVGTAMIAAEDARFYDHMGFDFEAINKAWRYNSTHKSKMKGGSTISQQLAKNIFLWPDRSWLRKLLETYFTGLIEVFWTKRRILEVYMNVVELGENTYGVEAAAQKYFKKSARQLNRSEAALIASVLPSPRKWSIKAPSPYVRFRQGAILRRMYRIEAGL